MRQEDTFMGRRNIWAFEHPETFLISLRQCLPSFPINMGLLLTFPTELTCHHWKTCHASLVVWVDWTTKPALALGDMGRWLLTHNLFTQPLFSLNKFYKIQENWNKIGTGSEQSELIVTSQTVGGREHSILTDDTTHCSVDHGRRGAQ